MATSLLLRAPGSDAACDGDEQLLRRFPTAVRAAQRTADAALRRELPHALRSPACFAWHGARTRPGRFLASTTFATPLVAVAWFWHLGAPARTLLATGAVVAVGATIVAIMISYVTYSVASARALSSTIYWHRTAAYLLRELHSTQPWPARALLYACDATLKARRQLRTVFAFMLSVALAGCTVMLGKEWVEITIHPIAAAHASLALVATTIIAVTVLAVYYAPVLPLDGVRDALSYLLSEPANETGADPEASAGDAL